MIRFQVGRPAAAGLLVGALLLALPVAGQSPGTVPSIDELVGWAGPDGDPERLSEGILRRASVRSTREATLWIQLVAVLERVAPRSAPTVVRAVGLGDQGEGPRGAELLMDGLPEMAASDHAPVLALAALLAEEENPMRAGEIRARLLDEHPGALEAPEAWLRQARWLLSMDLRRDEGLRLLEDLIVEMPDHPISPSARRILQQERSRSAPSANPLEDL